MKKSKQNHILSSHYLIYFKRNIKKEMIYNDSYGAHQRYDKIYISCLYPLLLVSYFVDQMNPYI